jgi:uncharacterized integral membrane protein
MTVTKGKYMIGGLWLFGFVILFILMTVETIAGTVFGARTQEAWEWLTPNVLPTVGLILGGYIADAQKSTASDDAANPAQNNAMLVVITFILSLLHLSILLFVIFVAGNKTTIDETFHTLKAANLPLGAIQGLITLTIGIFFKNN